jgi:tetratricopeptide (TPR) repeat protein
MWFGRLPIAKAITVFLIGAGTSRPAEIPTAGDLIDEWRTERYNEERSNDAEEIPDEELHDWAESYEKSNIGDEEDRYGFWFEQQYTTRGERRNFIRGKVEDKDPTFGINVLASLMDEGYIPLTLTTNFDDLLYDALYRFIETKPFTIDHNAIAAEFRLTKDRPTIIKLHGDYLYDNLQNTAPEKETLQNNMEKALSRALNEYGLIVVGYGGTDESIMDEVLLSDDLEISEYGVFWCGRDIDDLSPKAKEFLKKDGTQFVEIEGSEPFFTKVSNRIPEIDPPTADELQENADRKIESIDRTREQRSREANTEEEKMHLEALNYASQASQYLQDDEWQKAIDQSTEAIELQPGDGPSSAYFTRARAYQETDNHIEAIEDYSKVLELSSENAIAYNNRGNSYHDIGKYERAIEDRTTAIKLNPEYADAHSNRSETRLRTGAYTEALEDAQKGYELADDLNSRAAGLMLTLIAKIVRDEGVSEMEREYRQICSQDFISTWSFEELEGFLDTEDMEAEKEDKIREIMALLREHKDT